MKFLNKLIIKVIYILCITIYFIPVKSFSQQTGITRTNLQRYDLQASGYETIQARIDFEKGTSFGMHSHPGEEVIYVLEGTFEYQIEGKQPVILKGGEVLFIPAGKNHSAKNIGNNKASELATYIVQKGKQLLVMKK
ncbi:cupin domain-containing protein [Chryseobacterium wanjuense]